MICLGGNGTFDFDVVGESAYQRHLALLAGPKKPTGCDIDCLAVLALHDSNPYDSQAVAVAVARSTTSGLLVGYLSRSYARRFRAEMSLLQKVPGEPVVCRARIVGGWDDGFGDVGHYGLKLDLKWPLFLRTAAVHGEWMKRLI
jgi:hypothetical protein